jgi:hypothetical protein
MDAAHSSETSEISFRIHGVTSQTTAIPIVSISSQCALLFGKMCFEVLTAENIKITISGM